VHKDVAGFEAALGGDRDRALCDALRRLATDETTVGVCWGA